MYGRPEFCDFDRNDRNDSLFYVPYSFSTTNEEFSLYPQTNFYLAIAFTNFSVYAIYLSNELNVSHEVVEDSSLKIITVPILSEFIFSFSDLNELDISQNSLEVIPDLFHNLPALEVLKIHSDSLKLLPQSLSLVPNLRDLFISGNNLAVLPAFIGNIHSLQYLSLEINKVTSLPNSLSKIVNLKAFCLESETINDLPSFIFEWEHLEIFFLHIPNLPYLPDFQKELYSLKKIIWILDNLQSVPQNLDRLGPLKKFFLYAPNLRSYNGLEKLTTEILSICSETDFDPKMNLSDSILVLELISKNIQVLPKLPKRLKLLKLSIEGLKDLPDDLFELKDLEILELASNQITSLPEKITQLENLTQLEINGTNITELPPFLFRLPRLVKISFSPSIHYDKSLVTNNITIKRTKNFHYPYHLKYNTEMYFFKRKIKIRPPDYYILA